jgi:hypothetical protein
MLKPIPHQGIELSLGDVQLIRAFQQGGSYWELETQKLIRSTLLGRFLPRVETSEAPAPAPGRPAGGTALFQLVQGGKEVASTSAWLSEDDIPPREVEALDKAIGDLRRLAADPACDPSKKKLLEVFKLPDPVAMPECYRTYGSFWNRRLLVLWGYERKEGDSIDPALVSKRLAGRIDGSYRLKKRLADIVARLILVLLAVAVIWFVRHAMTGGGTATDDAIRRLADRPVDANALRNWDANRAVAYGRDPNFVMVPFGDGKAAPVVLPAPTGTKVFGALTAGPEPNTVTVRVVRPGGQVVNTVYPLDWIRRYGNWLVVFDPLTRRFIPTGPLTVDPAIRAWLEGLARPLEGVAWSVEIKSEIVSAQYALTAQLVPPDLAELKVTKWLVGGVPQASTASTISVPAAQENWVEVQAESSADPGRVLSQKIQIGKR